MATIFENQAGIVVHVSQKSAVQKQITARWFSQQEVLGIGGEMGFNDISESVSQKTVLLTSLDISESVFATVAYSADNDVYLNVGGDKLGSMTLSGMLFEADCNNYRSAGRTSGLTWLRKMYRDFRTSTRNERFMISQSNGYESGDGSLSFGTLPVIEVQTSTTSPDLLRGLVYGYTTSVTEPGGAVFSFRLNTHLLPY
jgi:hypothetical protein